MASMAFQTFILVFREERFFQISNFVFFHSGFERKVIIFKLQGVPSLARCALPEFEVNSYVDKHVDSDLMVTFFTIKRNIFVFFRRLRGLRYWTGLTDCQREEFTSWVLYSNLREKKIENTISISTQTLKNNDSFLNKCIGDIHTITLKHKKLR